jgi:hypothetical protein
MLTELIGVRFDLGTYQLIQKVAEVQGIGSCDFVRWAVRRELAELGVLPDDERRLILRRDERRGERKKSAK